MGLTQILIYAVIFVAGAAGGVKFHAGLIAQRDLEAEHAASKVAAKRADRIDVAAVGFEKDKARIRTEFLPITQEVERVVQKTVYSNVCFDDDGLRVINAAIHPAAAASQPAPAVPRSAAPD